MTSTVPLSSATTPHAKIRLERARETNRKHDMNARNEDRPTYGDRPVIEQLRLAMHLVGMGLDKANLDYVAEGLDCLQQTEMQLRSGLTNQDLAYELQTWITQGELRGADREFPDLGNTTEWKTFLDTIDQLRQGPPAQDASNHVTRAEPAGAIPPEVFLS